MRTFKDYKSECMEDPKFKKEYDALIPEMNIIRALIRKRNELNLTQKELAEITGINQSDISKIENGTRNPSLKLLKRLAEGMDMVLNISLEAKNSFQKKVN